MSTMYDQISLNVNTFNSRYFVAFDLNQFMSDITFAPDPNKLYLDTVNGFLEMLINDDNFNDFEIGEMCDFFEHSLMADIRTYMMSEHFPENRLPGSFAGKSRNEFLNDIDAFLARREWRNVDNIIDQYKSGELTIRQMVATSNRLTDTASQENEDIAKDLAGYATALRIVHENRSFFWMIFHLPSYISESRTIRNFEETIRNNAGLQHDFNDYLNNFKNVPECATIIRNQITANNQNPGMLTNLRYTSLNMPEIDVNVPENINTEDLTNVNQETEVINKQETAENDKQEPAVSDNKASVQNNNDNTNSIIYNPGIIGDDDGIIDNNLKDSAISSDDRNIQHYEEQPPLGILETASSRCAENFRKSPHFLTGLSNVIKTTIKDAAKNNPDVYGMEVDIVDQLIDTGINGMKSNLTDICEKYDMYSNNTMSAEDLAEYTHNHAVDMFFSVVEGLSAVNMPLSQKLIAAQLATANALNKFTPVGYDHGALGKFAGNYLLREHASFINQALTKGLEHAKGGVPVTAEEKNYIADEINVAREKLGLRVGIIAIDAEDKEDSFLINNSRHEDDLDIDKSVSKTII